MTLVPTYSASAAILAGNNGVPAVVQVDLNGNVVSPGGGSATVAIAAAKSAVTVVKASAGRLCRVLVQTAVATNAVLVYDNATAASGTVIGVIPVGAAVGSYDFEMPASNGITVGGNATNPAMTVSFY